MIEEELFEYLRSSPAVAALVVTPDMARIYEAVIPQGHVSPALVYQRLGTQEGLTFCGVDGLARVTMQIDAYAKTAQDARALARAVFNALVLFYGPTATTFVKHCSLETEFGLDDPEPGLLRRSQTWVIWCTE